MITLDYFLISLAVITSVVAGGFVIGLLTSSAANELSTPTRVMLWLAGVYMFIYSATLLELMAGQTISDTARWLVLEAILFRTFVTIGTFMFLRKFYQANPRAWCIDTALYSCHAHRKVEAQHAPHVHS